MSKKLCYFIKLEQNGEVYWGECGIFEGLSIDDVDDYESVLNQSINDFQMGQLNLTKLERYPSIRFGIEQIVLAMENDQPWKIFNNDFYNNQKNIPINGLIWMGKESFLREQVQNKIDNGFKCIKLKIGALDWQTEMDVLRLIRAEGGEDLVLRVDANGAWNSYDEAMPKLEFLSSLQVHSIEQPLKVGLNNDMAKLCQESPVGIAFDEELFEHTNSRQKTQLLSDLRPQFIVLKPSLVGGIQGSDEWITAAKSLNISYWITSALESNIGLNAIAQYTYQNNVGLHQGLGTGGLYTNNFPSPLNLKGEKLFYDKNLSWNTDGIV